MKIWLVLLLIFGSAASAHAGEWKERNDEALALLQQRDYENGIDVAQRALQFAERTEGASHPDVAASLNTLGRLYDAQGLYAPAESFYLRSLIIKINAFGLDHPEVAMSLSNIGTLYAAQKKYATAELLYTRAFEIMEHALGPDHPDVGRSLTNLGALYVSQGRYEQAEPLLKRALSILEKGLSPYHPDVADVLNGIASLYRETGREEAAQLIERCIGEIRSSETVAPISIPV